MTGVVFDPGAVPNFSQHFEVVTRSLFNPLGFKMLLAFADGDFNRAADRLLEIVSE